MKKEADLYEEIRLLCAGPARAGGRRTVANPLLLLLLDDPAGHETTGHQ